MKECTFISLTKTSFPIRMISVTLGQTGEYQTDIWVLFPIYMQNMGTICVAVRAANPLNTKNCIYLNFKTCLNEDQAVKTGRGSSLRDT